MELAHGVVHLDVVVDQVLVESDQPAFVVGGPPVADVAEGLVAHHAPGEFHRRRQGRAEAVFADRRAIGLVAVLGDLAHVDLPNLAPAQPAPDVFPRVVGSHFVHRYEPPAHQGIPLRCFRLRPEAVGPLHPKTAQRTQQFAALLRRECIRLLRRAQGHDPLALADEELAVHQLIPLFFGAQHFRIALNVGHRKSSSSGKNTGAKCVPPTPPAVGSRLFRCRAATPCFPAT